VKNPTRLAIFKWRQTAPELILCAVRWYLRYSLSLRDVEELVAERGLAADHTTIWRWVQRYGPELEQRLRRHLKPTNKSWRVDETYIRVQSLWCYLYRAIDSTDATIDFLLSALRDAGAAKRLFRRALSAPSHPQPRVINTDQARLYGAAIAAVKAEGTLRRRCRYRPVQYLNNSLEQDHRAIKRRVKAKQNFREFRAVRLSLCATTVLGAPPAHSKMIRARCASACALLGRRAQRSRVSRSSIAKLKGAIGLPVRISVLLLCERRWRPQIIQRTGH
jgi:transposase, IS6 family